MEARLALIHTCSVVAAGRRGQHVEAPCWNVDGHQSEVAGALAHAPPNLKGQFFLHSAVHLDETRWNLRSLVMERSLLGIYPVEGVVDAAGVLADPLGHVGATTRGGVFVQGVGVAAADVEQDTDAAAVAGRQPRAALLARFHVRAAVHGRSPVCKTIKSLELNFTANNDLS